MDYGCLPLDFPRRVEPAFLAKVYAPNVTILCLSLGVVLNTVTLMWVCTNLGSFSKITYSLVAATTFCVLTEGILRWYLLGRQLTQRWNFGELVAALLSVGSAGVGVLLQLDAVLVCGLTCLCVRTALVLLAFVGFAERRGVSAYELSEALLRNREALGRMHRAKMLILFEEDEPSESSQSPSSSVANIH